MTESFPVTNVTKQFSSTSRYRKTSIYEGPDGQFYFGLWQIPIINEHSRDTFYTLQFNEGRRLDKVSYMQYGNPLYWWIIAVANNIVDPFSELVAGQTIRIPYLPYVLGTLN